MAEGERSFLGLTHNPFVEPFRGFFERGGRKSNLEQLRHLSQWSRRVLLVTGAQGVGKTTLYRELAATLEPRVKAARISASLVNTGREVLAAVAQGFGLAASSTANSQSLRRDLITHVEAQASGDRPCLVLVDDAQLLDNRAVNELISLTQQSALHLVLFGEVRMVPVVERAASSRSVGWQEIRLTGYGEADARDYLEWRFQQARYRGRIPFTDQQVRDLVKLSGGLPGRINQMANVLLVKLETGEIAVDRGRFPRLHLAVLGLLVIVVALLYVLSIERPGRVDTVALTLPVQTPVPADTQEPVAAEAVETPESLETPEPPVENSEPVAMPGPVETLAALGTGMPGPASEAVDAADGAAADDTGGGAAGPATAEAVVADEPVLETLTAWPDGSEPVATPKSPPPEDPSPRPSSKPPVAKPQSRPQVQAAAPAPAIVESPTAAEPTEAEARDSRWLLKQNPEYYTLQLVTLSALDRARAFVAKQREPGEFAIYQLQRDGRVLHVVLYGLFSSRDAAERAADQLPAEVGDVRPWIRRVGQVQDAARTSGLQ